MADQTLLTCEGLGAIALSTRVLLGMVFVLSGGAKVRQPSSSNDLLSALGLGAWTNKPMAMLPYGEGALGLMLILGIPGSIVLAQSALGLFAAVLAITAIRGYRGTCGCFGNIDSGTGLIPLMRTTLLFGAATFVSGVSQFAFCAAQPLWITPLSAPMAIGLVGFAGLCLWGTSALIGSLQPPTAEAREGNTGEK